MPPHPPPPQERKIYWPNDTEGMCKYFRLCHPPPPPRKIYWPNDTEGMCKYFRLCHPTPPHKVHKLGGKYIGLMTPKGCVSIWIMPPNPHPPNKVHKLEGKYIGLMTPKGCVSILDYATPKKRYHTIMSATRPKRTKTDNF